MDIAKNLEKRFSLKDKVIILTGATGGIGEAIAKGLAEVGGRMVLSGTSQTKLEKLTDEIAAAGGEARGYVLNLEHKEQIKPFVDRVMEEFGRIDVLINCAGINKREGFLDFTEEDYDRIMNIDLKGLYFLSQEVAKHMKEAHNGSIINVASHNSVGMLGGCSVYGAAKSAVVALTRSMAVEWSQYGIRANAVAPGHILTPLTKVNWEDPNRTKYLKERIAMERPGDPYELVGTMILLASDASSYMSGMMLHVDGGCLAGGTPWPYHSEYDNKFNVDHG